MSYQVKRINPYWHSHPMIPASVAIGIIVGAVGFVTGKAVIGGIGALIVAGAILFAAKPVLSALLGTLGVLGGLAQFVVLPRDLNTSTLSLPMRWGAAILFGLFYMVLMDALVLVVAVLYNLYASALGLGGLSLDLEAAEDEGPAA
ncbi:MAG: DUF3566 domain-containing protein [Elusimicrobia bacterium]|nr:DUF3566 domain-containing protein [Elusimicrobiota bacterium]MDE2237649.1 DUF3566 domain-containing protein [Elusimicrobiota bacterium]MDE2426215.1 DUF3566 domain-containing protein [Elusimicrobiota bacterium]